MTHDVLLTFEHSLSREDHEAVWAENLGSTSFNSERPWELVVHCYNPLTTDQRDRLDAIAKRKTVPGAKSIQ